MKWDLPGNRINSICEEMVNSIRGTVVHTAAGARLHLTSVGLMMKWRFGEDAGQQLWLENSCCMPLCCTDCADVYKNLF